MATTSVLYAALGLVTLAALSPGVAQTPLPDLVIADAAYQVVTVQLPPPEPGTPIRGSDPKERTTYRFMLLVYNDGDAVFTEAFTVSWEQLEPVDESGQLSGRSVVNRMRGIILPGEGLWFDVWSYDEVKAGARVRFWIEPPYREGELPRYEESQYHNNGFEWEVVREE
ncbi:MAG: hypothetical protein OEV30_00835 [Ignavibacteria bacterium]|nr:hypothetical protein [Ignavibacteria bacterium]